MVPSARSFPSCFIAASSGLPPLFLLLLSFDIFYTGGEYFCTEALFEVQSLYSEEDGLLRVVFFQVEPEKKNRKSGEGIFGKGSISTQERLLWPGSQDQDQEVVTLRLDFFS